MAMQITNHGRDAAGWLEAKRGRILLALACVFAVQGIVLGATIWTVSHRDTPWSPLGDYPEQHAPETVYVERDGPPVFFDVTAKKCAEEDVRVQGSSAWVSVEPPGVIINIATSAVAERSKGCTTFLYHNQVPADLIRATADLGGVAVWRLTGVEQPVSPDRTGVPAAWRTTPIRLIVS